MTENKQLQQNLIDVSSKASKFEESASERLNSIEQVKQTAETWFRLYEKADAAAREDRLKSQDALMKALTSQWG